MCVEPLLGVHLVGAQDRAYFVVEDLGRGAGQRAQSGVHEPHQVLVERLSEPLAPSVTSSAVKPCTWMPGAASFTARHTSM